MIYNLDETSIYYNNWSKYSYLINGQTIPTKNSKDRITYVACTNCFGKYQQPIIIGKHVPKKVINSNHYYCNKSSWMTSAVFTAIINKWDVELERNNSRILLLVDNFSGHKIGSTNNIRIEFLPPNTTSKVQPLDLGIISNFKRLFQDHRSDEKFRKKAILDMNDCFEISCDVPKPIKSSTFWNCFKLSPVFEEVMVNPIMEIDPQQPLSVGFDENTLEEDDEFIEDLIGCYDHNQIFIEKTDEDREMKRVLKCCEEIMSSNLQNIDELKKVAICLLQKSNSMNNLL